ncbi:MAG: ATP-dependent DNA ligase [Candidatus Aenigmatarchaeota archaeon]
MKYSDLCEYYKRLESTTKNLEMRDIVSELLQDSDEEELEIISLASMGRIFPAYVDKDIGIAGKLMQKIISKAYGIKAGDIENRFRDTGDLGETAEYFCQRKKQQTLMQKELTVKKVYENLRKIPDITGSGSQEKKMNIVKELLVSAKPIEARYIVKTALEEMRIGVGEGTVRDAIAKAFDVEAEKVENAFFVLTDYGKVAKIAKEEGEEELENVEIEVFKPIRTMHPERSESFESAFNSYEDVSLEVKYDGFRAQLHKKGDEIRIFSRRLDEKTKQFPEVVKWAKEHLDCEECIIDSEILAVDENGNPLPFQKLSRRIQREYDIEKMSKEIPVQVNCFDIFYLEGKNYMWKPLRDRWKRLKDVVKVSENKFKLADHFETDDIEEAKKFYQKALDMGEEGVIIKNMKAKYQPGKRVGYWKKVKETMEPLDLVITEGRWGEGKRSEWISSLLLAVRDPETGDFVSTTRLGTGLTEEQLGEITDRLQEIIVEEEGRQVRVKPKIVVEIGYEEIQKSPKYGTGYALRFPRLLRFRPDKGPEEADTTERLKSLYDKQSD